MVIIVNGGGATGGFPGGVLSAGIGTALLGVVIAALICHVLFYLVPGMLGMKTGLPLYVVGTSTYGVVGGFFMPGFLMGLLQFGWLAVIAFAVAKLLCECFGLPAAAPSLSHGVIAAVFTVVCAFVGLKGIQYVAKVATFLPLIPLVVLIVLVVKTAGGLGSFDPAKTALEPAPAATTAAVAADVAGETPKAAAKGGTTIAGPGRLALTPWAVIAILSTYIVGFFATAGAAGTDIASNGRNSSDVQLGGLGGIALATIISGGLALLIVAGAYGSGMVHGKMLGELNPVTLMKGAILSEGTANIIMILLAISSFPAACFSAFIAANSFKTTLPQVNPFISVGLGTLAAVVLAVTGVVAKVIWVFVLIGASFGPVCGAMVADYLLSGRKWAGPRAGFNPAGWISWIVGFAVGAFNLVVKLAAEWSPNLAPKLADVQNLIPAPPVAAFLVGFVLYIVLAKIGLQSRTLEMPGAAK